MTNKSRCSLRQVVVLNSVSPTTCTRKCFDLSLYRPVLIQVPSVRSRELSNAYIIQLANLWRSRRQNYTHDKLGEL